MLPVNLPITVPVEHIPCTNAVYHRIGACRTIITRWNRRLEDEDTRF